MNNVSTTETLRSIWRAELSSAEQLLAAIVRARDAGDWLEDIVFSEILTVGMRLVDRSASDLARDESISRSAVSKWLNQVAIPSVPTRKTVILWLEEQLEGQRNALKDKLSSHESTERVAETM